jgi:hypothetical protein
MIVDALARGAGAVTGIFVIIAAIALLYLWLASVAELFWALFLRPTAAVVITTTLFVLSLTGAAVISDMRASLLVAVFVSPLLAWCVLNLWSWLRAPCDHLPEPRAWKGLFDGAWFNAFEETERARQRASYVAPVTFLDSGDDR